LGCKRVVVGSCIGIGFVFVLLQWADRYLAFHGVFFLLGLAAESFSPTMIPIISETYASRHWGKVLGIYDSAASSSVFAVPLLVTFWNRIFPLLSSVAAECLSFQIGILGSGILISLSPLVLRFL
jgi:hypothetical protein